MTALSKNSAKYKQHVKNVAANQAIKSVAGRDIANGWDAETPTPEELELREKCKHDLRLFLLSYFPKAFPLPFSPDHDKVITQIQTVGLTGGLSAIAMPRKSGKTTILTLACIWALVYGHHRYVVLIGAKESLAEQLLGDIKQELASNEYLRRPFREVCFPLRSLEWEARRTTGQLFEGNRTAIEWTAKKLVLPTMPSSACSGSVLSVAGITGAVRGLKRTLPTGEVVRPSLILLDDPQDRESAISPAQTAERLAIIRGDLLNLSGNDRKPSTFCACTVIRQDDLADQLLNRERMPEWQGIRTSAVHTWASNSSLWDKYLELRADGLRTGKGLAAANDFYSSNRAAMDDGASVAWPEQFFADEISGLQNKINLRADIGEEAFAAEFQNQPIRPQDEDVPMLSAAEIATKQNGYPRFVVPDNSDHVVAFIDVGDAILHYTILATSNEYDAAVIDYGTYPDQGRAIASVRKAARTLSDVAPPNADIESAIRSGLENLSALLMGRTYKRGDGSAFPIEKLLIDSGYKTDTILDFVRVKGSPVIMATRGWGLKPGDTPFDEFKKRPGETLGHHWVIPPPVKGRSARRVVIDTNYWKTFVHTRLLVPIGGKHGLTLFTGDHQYYADSLTSEFATRTTAKGRTVDIWQERPAAENHYFDTLTGAYVAASMVGACLPGTTVAAKLQQAISLNNIERQRNNRNTAVSPYIGRYGYGR